ncbi:MAG: ketoacyl-ACP synthase III [Acidobacteria bacterium]|nr:ketoacyl-ACP synthase III [Acidobacteriota bacterium]
MQKRPTAKIVALGRCVPPRVLSNADLEKLVETSDSWIVERTGIRERHIADPGVATSDLAAQAAREALSKCGTRADEIDLIIVCTVTPDMLFPSTACLVQDKIGASRAWGFDLSAACSGFVYGLSVAAQFISTGALQKVLVIGSDVMSSIVNYQDRATCVIFGDGAGAVLMEPSDDPEFGLLDFYHEIDGSGGQFLYMPGGGSLHPPSHETVDRKMHYVHQDGQAVFKYAVRKMYEASRVILARNRLTPNDIQLFIAHQANLRIVNATAERLGLDDGRVVRNIQRFGNTTAGTIPLAMADALEGGRLKKGDLVLFAAVGAGYTVGTALLRWAY